ncbi:hypothetical protein U9M48_021429 [Paspalum notatum var. saurae]|uniref:Uncharacterized protein n=1 Tax=Paspalum notatum var. saurae TaxID=547442 RepID=A0AAQ3THI9_PASNO
MSSSDDGKQIAALEGDGPDDHHVVDGGESSADEGANPEDPLHIYSSVNDGCSEAARGVDAGAGDGDGGEVHEEDGESDGERGEDGDVRVPGAALGVGGGEDGVDEDEGADDLGSQAVALGVPGVDGVGAAAGGHVEPLLEALDDAGAADGAQALHDHVEEGAREGELARQEEAEGDGGVDVAAGDAGGAVDEREDHAAEGPGDALDAHGGALAGRLAHAHHRQDADVEEEEGGHELGDARAVEGPGRQLLRLEQRRRRWLLVVLLLRALRRRADGLTLRVPVRAKPNVLLLALHGYLMRQQGKRMRDEKNRRGQPAHGKQLMPTQQAND